MAAICLTQPGDAADTFPPTTCGIPAPSEQRLYSAMRERGRSFSPRAAATFYIELSQRESINYCCRKPGEGEWERGKGERGGQADCQMIGWRSSQGIPLTL